MSGPIYMKGSAYDIAWMMRWLAGEDLPTQQKPFRPFCHVCGWRKGGPDSWNGVTCKCGHNEPPIEPIDYERRRPTTQDECEAAFLRYRAITLLNEDDQKDYDEEQNGTYR